MQDVRVWTTECCWSHLMQVRLTAWGVPTNKYSKQPR